MKIIDIGQVIPKYYGITYFDYQRNIYICHVFPLNHIISYTRQLFNKIRNNVDNVDILKGRIVKLENVIILHKKEKEEEFKNGYICGLQRK